MRLCLVILLMFGANVYAGGGTSVGGDPLLVYTCTDQSKNVTVQIRHSEDNSDILFLTMQSEIPYSFLQETKLSSSAGRPGLNLVLTGTRLQIRLGTDTTAVIEGAYHLPGELHDLLRDQAEGGDLGLEMDCIQLVGPAVTPKPPKN